MAGSTARGLDRHIVGKIQPSGGQVTHKAMEAQHYHHKHIVQIPSLCLHVDKDYTA